MKESRILTSKIQIRASVFRQQFSMAKVYRKAQALFIKKNVAPLTQSIPFLSTTSLSFRIAVQSLKTPPWRLVGTKRLSLSGNRRVNIHTLYNKKTAARSFDTTLYDLGS